MGTRIGAAGPEGSSRCIPRLICIRGDTGRCSSINGVWKDHPSEAPGIVAHLYELKARETARIVGGVAPAAKSATRLFESGFDLFASPHEGLARFGDFAAESIQAPAQVNGSRVPAEQYRVS